MDKFTILSRAKARREWMRHFQTWHSASRTCRHFGITRKVFYFWHKRWLSGGRTVQSLMDRPRRPKSHPNTTSPELAERIIALRKETGYGPKRLAFFLKRDHGLIVGPARIHAVLRRAGLLSTRERRRRRKARVYHVSEPGHKVQVDVKYLDKLYDEDHPEGIRDFQYTAIDCCSRLRFTAIYEEISVENSVDFARRMLGHFPFPVACVQTDNGIEFTYALTPQVNVEHPLDRFLRGRGIAHKLIPVGRKEYNGKVERSHRTDDEEVYRGRSFPNRWARIAAARDFLHYYNNHRPHSALGYQTPVDYLRSLPAYQGVTYV
jgi:transposase InsO family protein